MMRFAALPLIALLAACAPQAAAPPAATAGQTATTPEARGRAFAEANCATCHAIGLTGESPYGPAPPFRAINAKYDVEGLAEAFAEGIEVGHRGAREMPAFELAPAEIDDLIAYLKSLTP